jgi:hypothetical protein
MWWGDSILKAGFQEKAKHASPIIDCNNHQAVALKGCSVINGRRTGSDGPKHPHTRRWIFVRLSSLTFVKSVSPVARSFFSSFAREGYADSI